MLILMYIDMYRKVRSALAFVYYFSLCYIYIYVYIYTNMNYYNPSDILGFRAVVSSPWYLDDLGDYKDWAAYLDIEIASFPGHAHPELVLGGEACMWGEYVDATNALSRYETSPEKKQVVVCKFYVTMDHIKFFC